LLYAKVVKYSAIRTGEPPLADGRNGLVVVEALEAADRAMKKRMV
jgi:hypothetical protein